MVGAALDRLIGVFSPGAQLKRTRARDAVRQYAAAKTNRLTGAWSPVQSSVNSIIAGSNTQIRARVRQLVRDFPYFARAVNVLTDFTVGTGLTFQSRVRDKSGKIDKVLCGLIEDAFRFWADEADIAGNLHFYDLMSLAKRQEVETGEFLIVKRRPKSSKTRFIPFALQAYEPDWLTTRSDTGTQVATGKVIYQGIEYDTATGEIMAYHLMDPYSSGSAATRIPAEDVIHGFHTLRPSQLRGVSVFAPSVLVAHDLSDYMDAEIDAAKMAAKWLAFIETPDLAGFQGLRATQNTANTSQMIEELENAIIEYLRPGEKVTMNAYNRGGDTFDSFTSLILRMVAVATGVSYELLSGDYSGLNYTVLRGIRNDLEVMFAPLQKRMERQFCRKVLPEVIRWATMTGKLKLPSDYNVEPWRYLASQWIPPGMPAVDPLKEGRANADMISSRLKSPQEVAAERGRDYEEILDEIQVAEEMQRERGIFPELITNSTKTNPASLDDDEEETVQAKPAKQPGRAILPLRAI